MFRLRTAASLAAIRKKSQNKQNRKLRRKKRLEGKGKDNKLITGCVGLAIDLRERKISNSMQSPRRQGCSTRCRHAPHLKDGVLCSSHSKTDDWISEDLYKHFTETDSRPLSPENYSKRSVTLARSSSVMLEKVRKCVTPEPDAKQCQFHNRRVLILDLRRVKSVDAITRQNSLTTGESVDSTYGDADYDNRSSSVNRDSSSIFHHSTPRNFSMSRSTSPKGALGKRGLFKKKDRPGSPVAYERSSSPKILEGLTLPPLHQSVLTLLGQKAGVKCSPRNHPSADDASALDSSANKAKKLRRHGRKKKGKEEGKDSEEKEIVKSASAEPEGQHGHSHSHGHGRSANSNANDELQETQLSILRNQNDEDTQDDEGAEYDELFYKAPPYVKEIKSLRDILDEHLCKEIWSQKEMESLSEEIEKLTTGLRKYQTDFKTKSISMKEDTWLGFPRTCMRASATFGVPSMSGVLKDLKPVDYLRNYVTVSDPRTHLYGLVYQRYRILENPTGKTITVKSLQRAVSEVLGRNFSDKDMQELQHKYLHINDNHELDQQLFTGICAFCERVYGSYKLEDCKECLVCAKLPVNDKERCHMKRKNELELMDLSYLSTKIKFGEATGGIRELVKALTETGENKAITN